MNSQKAESLLAQKGIKPTANRIIVLKALFDEHRPLSLSMLENLLLSMDKSSIFRVLTLFLEHDVVHAFEDGKGVVNYELCAHRDGKGHAFTHAHFYCESCSRTFCLEDVPVRDVELPDGFVSHSLSFVVKGECAECRNKRRR